MNLRFYITCIALLLCLGIPVTPTLGIPFLEDSNITATVYGATYTWDTFEPLNDTIIDVNSIPPQSIVAKNGMYSFELAPGDYIITAKYYRNDTLVYSKETTLKIENEGSYVLDLLLYPVSENTAAKTVAAHTNNANDADPVGGSGFDSTISYAPIALMLLILLGGYKLSSKTKKVKKSRLQERKLGISELLLKTFSNRFGSGVKPEYANAREAFSVIYPVTEPVDNLDNNSEIEPATSKKPPLPTDLCKVLDIIRGHKGKITQKDLRSKLDYSEVKVSLMLSELEKRGLVKKFKNGRENIVVIIKR